MSKATVLIGNPKPSSRTRRAALEVGRELCATLGFAPPRVVDLAELAPELLSDRDGAVAEAVQQVREADLLLVATPTFKATYTGLLKLFLDLLPRGGLTGVVAVPMMTSAQPGHRYAVDLYLRALLVELGASVPVPGISLLEADLPAIDRVLGPWSTGAVPVLAAVLGARGPARRSWAG